MNSLSRIYQKYEFSPFAWGDFWKTGGNARQAASRRFGYRKDGSHHGKNNDA
jgi:hypothetical protein